jgi:hypothetical protein
MEGYLVAHDRTLPPNRLLALAALLKEARCIERDLAGRLSRHPKQKSVLKQHGEYQRLVAQLTCEFEAVLARYVARIKTVSGPDEGAAMRPSGQASAACRPAGRRTSVR